MIETLTEKIKRNIKQVDVTELSTEYLKLHEYKEEIYNGFSYAAIIQQGMLPQQRHFERLFQEHFVIYQPQNIVSGDFYWIAEKNDTVLFAVADCTGHGISGAMLSVLGISFLNYVVLGKCHDCLGKMLEEVDKKWIETFNVYSEKGKDNDWMEISLGSFNPKTRVMKFAGARGKITVINGEGTQVIKGDRYPIGGWQIESNRTYHETEIILPEGSMVYLSSDGFKDQVGGPTNKTMKERQVRKLLNELFHLPADIQKSFLSSAFNEWRGNNNQMDDVCLMGLRL